MPKYKFKAIDLNNEIVRGTFFARDEDDLREIINNQNYYLISSHKIAESSQMFSFLEKVKTEDLIVFCQQLSIMITSGMHIVKAIELLKANTMSKKLKEILEVVYVELQQGKMLSDTFNKYPKTFPIFFRHMVQIGEMSGRLDLAFTRLAEYYEQDAKTKKQIKSALSYPIFLIVMIIAVLAVLALVIMPIFAEVFTDIGVEIPGLTRVILDVTAFIKENFLFLFLGLIGLIVFIILIKRLHPVKRFFDKLKLTFPGIKTVICAIVTSRFTSGFNTLYRSGMPIVDSLEAMSNLLGNIIVQERMQIACNEVKRGQSISKSLATIDTFPQMLIEMISIGEQTGSLETVLDEVNDYYETQVGYAVKRLSSSIEPIMIMIVAALIVVVILAVYMPIFDIMNSLEGLG